MSPIIRILAVSAALAAAGAGVAAAQDWKAAPTYGRAELASGFSPDPYNVAVRSGGANNAAQSIGGACTGFVATPPDFDLQFTTAGNLPLIISVAANVDTTLVVNGPNQEWHCDDDSGGGNNPSVRIDNPQSGLYDIWIGTFGNAAIQDATLSISELNSN
jgi:hypothetical protein